MADYSDLIALIGAMVIFSFLSRNASYMFYQSDTVFFQSDVEYEAIALAQSIMDEVKWTQSDSELNTLANKYDGKTETISVKDGEYQIDYYISMTVDHISLDGSIVKNRLVTLIITSDYLPEETQINFKYIKNFK